MAIEDLKGFVKTYLESWIDVITDIKDGEVKNVKDTWKNKKAWTRWHRDNIFVDFAKRDEKYLCADFEGSLNEKCEKCKVCSKRKINYDYSIVSEYYRVDMTLYRYVRQSHWALDYAIEHENDEFKIKETKEHGDDVIQLKDKKIKITDKGWFDEFAKLLPLNCAKARVIIGYNDYVTNSGLKDIDDKLACCDELVEFWQKEENKAGSSFVNSPIILIIFPRDLNTLSVDDLAKDNLHNTMKIAIFDKDENGKLKRCEDNITKDILDAQRDDGSLIRDGIVRAYQKLR